MAKDLNQRSMLAPGTCVTFYRHRNDEFKEFFKWENKQTCCVVTNVVGLMKQLNFEYVTNDWRLFIDSSKSSLKAVLLHNGNELPTVPLAHSTEMKESYDDMKSLLQAIKYNEYEWFVIGDLKMVAILMGLQLGYTKFSCHLCLWDSRDDKNHFYVRTWPKRIFTVGKNNVIHEPLVKPEKIIPPPLHIKLGLIKNFVRALDKDGEPFKALQEIFPQLSTAKITAGVFDGPQIRTLFKNNHFELLLSEEEFEAWSAFKKVVEGFLGNHRASDYKERVDNMLRAYKVMGCRMSHKMHLLHSHIDAFPTNCGDYSDEQGERFHQTMKDMEHWYQGRWDPSMMADFCWMIKKE